MPNSKFEFCNCTSLIVTFRTIISTFYFILLKQNWKLSFVKLIHKRTNVCISATKCKNCSGRPKTARTVDACMELCMLFVICNAFNVLSVRTVFSLLLPVLCFVKNFADLVTVHVHEYVYISILLSSTFT